jgi:copper chaperone CopZ
MARITSSIENQPGVQSVEYSTRTGSILVHHDTQQSLHHIKGIMKDLGVAFADITGASELIPLNGKSEQESDLSTVLYDLNQQVVDATNGIIDLRFVLPLGLAALGVFQLLTFGLQLEVIPWYVLIYFAIDSFIRLNFQPVAAQS